MPAADPPVVAEVVSAAPAAETAPAEPLAAVVEAPAAPARRRAPVQQVSDETLDDWQSRLAAKRAAKERVRRQELAAASARQQRAEGIRVLREALAVLAEGAAVSVDPADAALVADDLARAVHEAPEHVRQVVAATMAMLSAGRR